MLVLSISNQNTILFIYPSNMTPIISTFSPGLEITPVFRSSDYPSIFLLLLNSVLTLCGCSNFEIIWKLSATLAEWKILTSVYYLLRLRFPVGKTN